MANRRKFLQSSVLGSISILSGKKFWANEKLHRVIAGHPIVISTWDAGLNANKGAWAVLEKRGNALDAVEAGVRVTEAEQSCCVGLGANPDRDGFVTLDACIMDERFNCGSVAFLERIKHPVSVARRVMEKTPHVMLVGSGAQQFALAEGFPLEEQKLSEDASKAYEQWLKKSEYKPVINIESSKGHGPFAPEQFENGGWNHDTIGMVAMDSPGQSQRQLYHQRYGVQDARQAGRSPIIGAGLFVDNEVGAVTATGQGEDVIRICGSHSVVEYMRQGLLPEQACKKAIERIMKIKGDKAKRNTGGISCIEQKRQAGAYAIHKGFSYALKNSNDEKLIPSKYFLE